jgi:ABC-type sugar transport system ATPase subunit
MTRLPFLEARGLTKRFPGVTAMDGVSLSIYPGEVHALLGENGAGKSTLLRTLFGAQQPDSGEILFNGEPIVFAGPADAIGRGIAMVQQELSLVPQLNAVQNVVLGSESTTAGVISWRAARKRAIPALAKFGFSGSPLRPVGNLSVAQQQLIELARGVAAGARMIIMDEPTSSLTTHESEQLFNVIRQLRSEGCAIVYVSHRLAEVLELADRLTVLRDGAVVSTLTRDEIIDEPQLVRLMVGRNLDAIGVDSNVQPGEEILSVTNLSVPGLVDNVSLSLRRGEIVGIAGMVGAGRTEFALGLIGALRSHADSVLINGKQVHIKSPHDAVHAGIAYLPEDRKTQGLILFISTARNLTLSNPPGRFGFVNRGAQRRTAASVMAQLSSKTSVDAPVSSLSGGNQQKVVVGRWMLTDSEIFIFDEPTRGVDVGAKAEIHRLMRRLADEGKGVLMISSDLPEVLAMSDRVLVMRRGRLTAEFDRSEATEEVIVAQAAG